MFYDFLIMTIRGSTPTLLVPAFAVVMIDRSRSTRVRRTRGVGPSARHKREARRSFKVSQLSRIRAVRLQHGLQAFGQRRTTLYQNSSVARTLFELLMNHGRRLFNQERAIVSHTAFRLSQHVISPIRPLAISRSNELSKSNRPERLLCPAHPLLSERKPAITCSSCRIVGRSLTTAPVPDPVPPAAHDELDCAPGHPLSWSAP